MFSTPFTFMKAATAAADADATAYLAAVVAAGGTVDATITSATNTLFTDLKTNSLYTKIYAMYPMLGGNSGGCKFNAKDPRDLDAAYRIVFNGGWTFSSSGATPNGTTAYGDTFLVPSSVTTNNNIHLSYYSLTNSASPGSSTTMGCSGIGYARIIIRRPADIGYNVLASPTKGLQTYTITNSLGYFLGSAITDDNTRNFYRNGVLLTPTAEVGLGSVANPAYNIYIGANSNENVAEDFDNKECAFSTIGAGLTTGEIETLSTIVNTFATTLGRAAGFDPDAQAFFTAAGITDTTEKSAVNQLVLDLKADSLWSLMKVIYPLVGTTSSQQSYNLVDPTTYQMDWLGGWTFSSNGALGNGTNTQANTTIDFSTLGVGLNSFALGTYNRLSVGADEGVDAGAQGVATDAGYSVRINFYSSYSGLTFYDPGLESERITVASPGTTGFWVATRTSSSVYGIYRNASSVSNTTGGSQTATSLPSNPFVFGDINSANPPSPAAPSSQQYAFMFVSDGLTSGQITTFNTTVQAFETSLGRQV